MEYGVCYGWPPLVVLVTKRLSCLSCLCRDGDVERTDGRDGIHGLNAGGAFGFSISISIFVFGFGLFILGFLLLPRKFRGL